MTERCHLRQLAGFSGYFRRIEGNQCRKCAAGHFRFISEKLASWVQEMADIGDCLLKQELVR
jgi:hypothetical protein